MSLSLLCCVSLFLPLVFAPLKLWSLHLSLLHLCRLLVAPTSTFELSSFGQDRSKQHLGMDKMISFDSFSRQRLYWHGSTGMDKMISLVEPLSTERVEIWWWSRPVD